MFYYVVDTETEKVKARSEDNNLVVNENKKIVEDKEEKSLEGLYYNDTDGFYTVELPPTPEEAKDKVEELLVQAYTDNGSDTPKMDANEMLDNYPSIYRHLDNGDYQFTIDYIRAKIEPNESVVTISMVDEYATFLQV